MPLLEAIQVTKTYPGVRALREASLVLEAAEVHALVGENGAGKSTLVKVLTGAVEPDSGTVRVNGKVVAAPSPSRMKALGIAAIYQQPSLFPHLTVAENIGLSLEPSSPWRRVAWKERRRRAQQLLDRIGARIPPDEEAGRLTMPQQQLLEIAKALGAEARVFIMDEPTASLTDQEVDHLFSVIGELKSRGAGILYISHRLEELGRIAERVTVLRDGESIATHPMRDLDKAAIVKLMVGRELSAVFPKQTVPIGGPVLTLRNLGSTAAGVRGVSLEVRAGEIVGLAGLVGSGRTELACTVFGLTPADQGEILLNGKPIRIDSPSAAIQQGIGYVPEDRRRHGLIQAMTIAENTTLANLEAVSRGAFLDFAKERVVSADFIAKLGTKATGPEVAVNTLSGGNQQKVVLSRWMAIEPAVLILDEPTQGVDVGAKAEVHRLIGEMAARGIAILMISSELPEILGMSDRILVMAHGEITGALDRADATQEKILALALPRERSE